MIVAGIMSGTSADGINLAFTRLTGRGRSLRLKLLAHSQYPYPAAVRRKILDSMNASRARVAELARLNFLLGELYADAILKARRTHRISRLDLIGCHGQTLYHQGLPKPFLGRRISATWQTGEASIVAARTATPVVSDFRPADLAAGGQGAPLVPLLDYLLFRHTRHGRILLNLGGIANLTVIPPGASPDDVVAFDTGPGNMVIDALAEKFFRRPYDHNGDLSARGKIRDDILQKLLRQPYFRQPPPKTAGREQFGTRFVSDFIRYFKKAGHLDAMATATALTAASISAAVERTVGARGRTDWQLIASGGGVRNRTLMRMLRERFLRLRITISTSDRAGLPSEAKEAAAFALLAYHTWHRLPGNLPSATGASRAAVLGNISYP